MSQSILTTKLYTPPVRPKMIRRHQLLERLNKGLLHNHKLTLVFAPAGFGKTTLLSDWIAACGRKAAWLSLEQADSDLTRFLTYLVAALQKIAPGIGEGVADLLQSSRLPPSETILITLLNEVASSPVNFVLVLDDYHLAETPSITAALNFLIERLPLQMHLVIATREEPALPLARLRARNQLTELRATDLRFTLTETTGFLKLGMGLDLSAENIATLEERTEGWIAGLQLAALSMQGHQNVSRFIQAFAGNHRYVLDYLSEEVLQRQSESVYNFLVQTSILDRLNGPLCDAITGQQEGSFRLEALERGNFFIVPLDDQRQWYRYHHLFAEVLYTHLLAEHPDYVATLHRRASDWYQQNGSTTYAIKHALSAQDFELVADLVEQVVPEMRRTRQHGLLLDWLQALPDKVISTRPVLNVHYAGALLASGQLEGVELRLSAAERWLATTVDTNAQHQTPPQGMIVIDKEEFRQLPALIAVYRAASALAQGNVAATVQYSLLALNLFPEDHVQRGAAAGLLGLAYWAGGNLEAASQAYIGCMAWMQRAGHISDTLGCALALADIRIAQGCLREAKQIYEDALGLAAAHSVLRGTADMYVGLSELYLEYNDFNTATNYLQKSKELGEIAGLPQNRYRWCVAMSRLKEFQGDFDGALEMLNEAERVYVSDFFPNVRPISALKVRLWLAQGRLGEALGWVKERGLLIEDELTYLHEFEYITLARVILAQLRSTKGHIQVAADYSPIELTKLLERLLKAAEEGNRTASIIEILLLLSFAYQLQGDSNAAFITLERALILAEPKGYIQIFVNEGATLAQLLQEAVKHRIDFGYVRHLLAILSQPANPTTDKTNQILVEPLSARELQVLRLFRTELTGPEIARQLIISLPTLRTHTSNIYAKLGVNNRRAAVRTAINIGLL